MLQLEFLRCEMMRKSAVLIIVIISFIFILAGCGSPDEPERTEDSDSRMVTVGFSQLGAESDWRVANTESIQSTLSMDNNYFLVFDDAQQKQEKQIMAIRKFIQQEVDCIVLAPVTETGWDTVLREAKDAGIPVIIVDRRVDVENDSLYTAWVGSDFDLEAELACEWLKRYTELKGVNPADIHILDIQGTLGATAQIGRTDGLAKAASLNGWDLVDKIPADYAQTKAKEVMQQMLRKRSDINVVYCENDNEAIGAIEAIEEAGKKVGSDIVNGEIMIISFDAAHSGLEKVLEGKIALDVECNPLQGGKVNDIIRNVMAGNAFEKYTYIEESVFAADDMVDALIIDGSPYEVTTLTQEILDGREY